jgi:hypothetical protein
MGRRRGTRIDTIAALDMETMRPMFGFGSQHFGPIAKAMGVRFPSVATNTFIGPLPANANETVVLTTPPLTLPLDGATVILPWMAYLTTGTGTTSIAYRIRRGTTTAGVLLNQNPWFFTSGPGNGLTVGGWYFDTPGAVAGQQYSLTIVQSAATAAAVWGDGALMAFAL